MKKLSTLFFLISILISSCVKTDENYSPMKENNSDKIAILKAKADYETHIHQHSKSSAGSELFWDDALVVKYGDEVMNIEVPLTNFTEESKSKTISRLIARKSSTSNHYFYFIVKRTLQEYTPDLHGKKLDDVKTNSTTRVYTLTGELLNEFSDTPQEVRITSNRRYTITCPRCGASIFSDDSQCSCGCPILDAGSTTTRPDFEKYIKPIYDNLQESIRKGKMYHSSNTTNGCYGTCCSLSDIALCFPQDCKDSLLGQYLGHLNLQYIGIYSFILDYETCKFLYMDRHFFEKALWYSKSGEAEDLAMSIADKLCNKWVFIYTQEHGVDPRPKDPCYDEKCPICSKCKNPSLDDCQVCTCCFDEKCPICGNCFVHGTKNPKCTYCEGDSKDMHLLQDSISRLCPNVESIFTIKNHPLTVRPFYKWESVELTFSRIGASTFGNNVRNNISSGYDLNEGLGASICGSLITLPSLLLINRNTDRLAASFLHELFHSRQTLSATSLANAEIEAKLAKMIFAEQAGIDEEDANLDDPLFYEALKELRSYIDRNGSVSSKNEASFNELFRVLAEFLSDKAKYPYDKSIIGAQNIQTLKLFL